MNLDNPENQVRIFGNKISKILDYVLYPSLFLMLAISSIQINYFDNNKIIQNLNFNVSSI